MSQRKKCRKILNVDRLCVIPSSVGNLILTLFKENLTLFQIAEEVKYYPSIAARVLAIANSAWSSPAVPVTNLLDACVRLGIATVQTLSLALAVNGVFDPLKCNSFDARRYWMSAMLTSLGADLFAKALGYSEQASTWRSVGLLHNLGLLWMADHIPTETAIALGRSRDGSISLVSIMQDEIGMDYLLVGGCLAEYWLLPQIFRNVIFNIRHPELAEEHAPPARGCGSFFTYGFCSFSE